LHLAEKICAHERIDRVINGRALTRTESPAHYGGASGRPATNFIDSSSSLAQTGAKTADFEEFAPYTATALQLGGGAGGIQIVSLIAWLRGDKVAIPRNKKAAR
jgi:hypothetical protein